MTNPPQAPGIALVGENRNSKVSKVVPFFLALHQALVNQGRDVLCFDNLEDGRSQCVQDVCIRIIRHCAPIQGYDQVFVENIP